MDHYRTSSFEFADDHLFEDTTRAFTVKQKFGFFILFLETRFHVTGDLVEEFQEAFEDEAMAIATADARFHHVNIPASLRIAA